MKRGGDGEWDYVVKGDSVVLEYSNMLQNFNEMVSEIKNLKIERRSWTSRRLICSIFRCR